MDTCTHPDHGQYTRWYSLGKYLSKMGHQPYVFVGSHPHNSNIQLIESRKAYQIYADSPFPWILVHTLKYGRRRLIRILSMFVYFWNSCKAAAFYAKDGLPDAIIGSSPHPLCNLLAIHLGRKYHCKSVIEIRDLWPESIVAYKIAGPHHPAVIFLRWLEKWMYQNADAIIFTMEGGYEYILERKWERVIPREKCFFINNGVDLEDFISNREYYQIPDEDLDNPNYFNIVYAGSIRRAYNIKFILDIAQHVKNPRVRFLIWGDGTEREKLEQRVREEQIQNVKFKGRVDKKYIAHILSRALLLLLSEDSTQIERFGISANKLFDYFAAGKPVLSLLWCRYHPGVESGAVRALEMPDAETAAAVIDEMSHMPPEEYRQMCEAAEQEAEKYDFSNLARSVVDAVNGGQAMKEKESNAVHI